MVFSSLIFIYGFFSLSLLAYSLCRTRNSQNFVLLVFSLIFYGWGEPKYVLLLMFMALADWFCALRISRNEEKAMKKRWLILAAGVDLLLIGYFKYAGLFCSLFGPVPAFVSRIILPIGISFYTFQLLTYVVDVYRGEAEAQESYWNVLLYAALFHQCIAGPIVRYKTIDQELFRDPQRQPELAEGVSRFAAGLAKKVLLANPCGALADSLILSASAISDPALFAENLETLRTVPVLGAWGGMLAFSLHIYLDFSAYSDMAIGMGRMLGLHYLENFNYPYISKSVTEFWRRWHMSLGTFFRDYVYIPLGGNRGSLPRVIFNTFVVWALTGLWHGASWNFLLWGLWFFLLLMAERYFLKDYLEESRILCHIYLPVMALLGWVIFRYTDIRLCKALLLSLFGLNGNPGSSFAVKIALQNNLFLLAAAVIGSTPLCKMVKERLDEGSHEDLLLGAIYDQAVYSVLPVILLILSTACLVGDSYNPFLYFQF